MECVVERLGRDAESMARWDRYVLDSATASGYHLVSWRDVVERAFGHQSAYFMVRDQQGDVRGVLPLVLLDSRLFGRFLVSIPFFNYGGVDAASHTIRNVLLNAAVQEANRMQATHVELRQSQRMECGWQYKEQKVSMRLKLPSDFQTLMAAFPSKLRSQIRRPLKEGMIKKIGGAELLDDFYRVFSRNMRDLGTPVYSKRFFRLILHTFPKETAVCSIYLNGTAIAAAFLYTFRDRMEIPWAAADRRHDRLAPNMLLYSSVLEYACLQGCKLFDFGRSTMGSGTYKFKEQWGAKPVPLYWYYWLPKNAALPELNPENPRYQFAISLWRHLPMWLTNTMGPYIVKYLP